jgi:hypothetical protein
MKQILIALAGASLAVSAAQAQDIKIISGTCGPSSMTATVAAKEDLGDHKLPFICDSAVISFTDPTHIMIQFAEKAASRASIVAYAGVVQNREMVDVQLYMEPGKPMPTDDGTCRIFWDGDRTKAIVCGAEAMHDNQRTVAVVEFNASAP